MNLTLSEKETQIAKLILREIDERLGFLINVGLDYLTLSRVSRNIVWRGSTANSLGNSNWFAFNRCSLYFR